MASFWIRERRLTRKFYGFLYGRCDAIVAISQQTRDDLVRTFPSLQAKITVIPNGVHPPEATGAVGREQKSKTIIHIGAFTFEKNQRFLIDIFDSLRSDVEGVRLCFVGDGPLRASCEEQVREKKLSGSVMFKGHTDDVFAELGSASVLVLPSLVEGVPGVVIEAMMAGVPVVAFDVGSVGEMLADGRGKAVPFGDEAGFVCAVTKLLLAEPDSLAEQLRRAESYAVKMYSLDAVTEQFSKLYDQLHCPG